jgi:membrane peptidoglycan carboxypeptidase
MSLIRVIDADGNVLEENAPVSEPSFLKPHTVEQMEQGLEAVVMGGSGTRARGDQTTGIVEGAHGKTGTTSDSRDAWFAGYTPELTTVIWVASVHRNKHGIINYEPMGNSTGGAVCAPIWHDFMIKAVLEERKYRQALQQLESRPALPQTAEVETPKKPKTNEHPIKTDPQPQSLAPAAGGTSPLWNHLPDSATKPDTGAKPADGANPAPATGTGQTDVGANTVPGTLAPAALTTSPTPTIAPPVTAPPTENAGPRATTPHIDAVAGGQAVAPPHPVAPRTAAPPATAAPEIVEVTLCVDSGKRATPWCPATNTVRMTRQQAAHVGRCRMHTPPPGEH